MQEDMGGRMLTLILGASGASHGVSPSNSKTSLHVRKLRLRTRDQLPSVTQPRTGTLGVHATTYLVPVLPSLHRKPSAVVASHALVPKLWGG